MKKIIYWTSYKKYLGLKKYMARMTMIQSTYTKETTSFEAFYSQSDTLQLISETYFDRPERTTLHWQDNTQNKLQHSVILDFKVLAYCYKLRKKTLEKNSFRTALINIWQIHIGLPFQYQRFEKMSCHLPKEIAEITLTATIIEHINQPNDLNYIDNSKVMVELKTTGNSFPYFINDFKKLNLKAGATDD